MYIHFPSFFPRLQSREIGVGNVAKIRKYFKKATNMQKKNNQTHGSSF